MAPRSAEPSPPGSTLARRSLLRAAAGTGTALVAGRGGARADEQRPLVAYVGTFSSPLKDTLPTQVDLPPGNGRGIHRYFVERTGGAWTPAGVTESGTSPSCLAVNATGTRLYSANETDRVGPDRHGTVTAYAIDRTSGDLTALATVPSG
ncbi:MAG: lactonase family protein, partial [Planctomycetia bacterium]|nr:lactonase family protein [Planctomycetia bacterium]